MPTRLWKALAVACALIALGVVMLDASDIGEFSDDHLELTSSVGGWQKVVFVSGTASENGGLQAGDLIRSPSGTTPLRTRLQLQPSGTVLAWTVRRGDATFATHTVVSAPAAGDVVYGEIVNAFRLALIAVALLVAVRRPEPRDARALVTFMVLLGLTAFALPAWLPDPLLAVYAMLRNPLQIIGLGYATHFACVFPAASATGVRAAIRRINLPFTFAFAVVVLALTIVDRQAGGNVPTWFVHVNDVLGIAFYYFWIAMTAAFVIGVRSARGADRQRATWAAGSFLLGFVGPLVSTIARVALGRSPDWLHYLDLTIVVIPIGLAYTILRHRTVDIGFVISRALVLTTVSFLIIAAFGLLERTLGKIFIDASHIASRTVEIALALGLGFSLRALHVRVERAVDFVFFRARRRSLAALRAFARDVFYISDPAVVRSQMLELLETHADAAGVVVIDDAGAQGDDPLFVRLRSAREPVRVRDTSTELGGELAFPMVVRGTLTGAVILAAKRSGETYDPEERTLIAEIVERAGIALDALHTLAIRRELEALRLQLTPVVPPVLGEGASATGGATSAF